MPAQYTSKETMVPLTELRGKNVLIRADSSPVIGTGHVMRMHVLAERLRDEGASVTFAMRDCPGNLSDMIDQDRYKLRLIKTSGRFPDSCRAHDYEAWLGNTVADDVKQSFNNTRYDLVIVDHYGATNEWAYLARARTRFIMFVDDEAIRDLHNCDIVLNQNFYRDQKNPYLSKVSWDCRVLLGPGFSLLRKEFQLTPSKIRTRLKKLLVMMGGADKDQITLKIAQTLPLSHKIETTLVVGPIYPNYQELKEVCQPKGFKLLQSPKNIAQLMSEADFCIGASGATSWERCVMKLPSALITLAENQVDIARNLSDCGATVYLGPHFQLRLESINETIDFFASNEKALTQMSQKSASLIKGYGPDKVACEINQLFVAD